MVKIKHKFLERRLESVVIFPVGTDFDRAVKKVRELISGELQPCGAVIKQRGICLYCFVEDKRVWSGFSGDCYLIGKVRQDTKKIAAAISCHKKYNVYEASLG